MSASVDPTPDNRGGPASSVRADVRQRPARHAVDRHARAQHQPEVRLRLGDAAAVELDLDVLKRQLAAEREGDTKKK